MASSQRLLFWFVFIFETSVFFSLSSPSCPETSSVEQADLELSDLPDPASAGHHHLASKAFVSHVEGLDCSSRQVLVYSFERSGNWGPERPRHLHRVP